MTTKTTSMRFDDNELALLDIIAAIQHERTGLRPSRTNVVRMLLKRAKPSDDLSELNNTHRRLYKTVFDS